MIDETDASWNVHGGKTPQWKNTECVRCGRSPAETVLNIEAIIHHNATELVCVDRDSCKKHTKRRKK